MQSAYKTKGNPKPNVHNVVVSRVVTSRCYTQNACAHQESPDVRYNRLTGEVHMHAHGDKVKNEISSH